MRLLTIITAAILGFLGGYALGTDPLPLPGLGRATEAAGSPLSPGELQTLVGSWEQLQGDDPRIQLVVREVRPGWASVAYRFLIPGRPAQAPDWIQGRAPLLPDGRLILRHPGCLRLQLSEDHGILLGTRTQGGRSGELLLWKAGTDSVTSLGTRAAPRS